MIIYSIIPNEIIFGNNAETSKQKTEEITYMGERIEVYKAEDESYVINRLISTSPKAFLNPRLQPGQVVEGVISREKKI